MAILLIGAAIIAAVLWWLRPWHDDYNECED
jgi:hypothetical protein